MSEHTSGSTVPLDLLRAVADPVRLATLGASVAGPVSIDSLAEHLGVPRKEISEAIGFLRGPGFLDDTGRLDLDVLRSVAEEIPPRHTRSQKPIEGPWTADEAELFGRFFDDGRLLSLPASAGKRRLMLERIVQIFEPGLRYAERDVNFRIQLIYADYAAIRRYPIDEGFMDRADGNYWRIGGRYETPATPTLESNANHVITAALNGTELRPYVDEMLFSLVEAANDPRIPRFMSDRFPHPYTIDDGRQWMAITTDDAPPLHYAIHVADALVGGVGATAGTGRSPAHTRSDGG